jgi:hypothetical protein
MLDNTTYIGLTGSLASIGIAQWSVIASLCAATLTCVYMCIQIYRAARKLKSRDK